MTIPASSLSSGGRPKAEKMVTLACSKCRMALYMSERELQMPTWRCPSCGAITRRPASQPKETKPA